MRLKAEIRYFGVTKEKIEKKTTFVEKKRKNPKITYYLGTNVFFVIIVTIIIKIFNSIIAQCGVLVLGLIF